LESDPDYLRFDHLVVAARTLDEGVAWIEERTGVAMGAGGRHATMGTHNRVMPLGPERFLEVIAIDPGAPHPGRSRWFELDTPRMQARLARGPALVHWVARSTDIARALERLGDREAEILPLARGDFRWKIGVPPGGGLQRDGTWPTVIEWQGTHPASVLADSGCRLERLVLRHPDAPATLRTLLDAGLFPGDPVEAHDGTPALEARLATPRGPVLLGE
jgi:hypothetical protein